jgi:hypothetical protein
MPAHPHLDGLPLNCLWCGSPFPAGSNHPDARGKGLGPHRYCPRCGAPRDLTEFVWGIACAGERSYEDCRDRLMEEEAA